MGQDDRDAPGDLTLFAYERGAEQYASRTPARYSPLTDRLIELVPAGADVLELGSGPGRDALTLEKAGLVVHRTDGAHSFVERLHASGRDASVLDIRADDLGGPYDAVFANAVLLHLERTEMPHTLSVIWNALRPGGVLVASLKKGSDDGWSLEKLDDARFFTYWLEADIERALTLRTWDAIGVRDSTSPGSAERWITLVARKPKP